MTSTASISKNLQLAYQAALRSYGMLFFSNKTWFSWIILCTTFFIPPVGIAGFIATIVSLGTARLLGFDPKPVSSGIYSYSALLYGLGLASYFEWSIPYVILLIIGSVLCTFISVALNSKLIQKNIPGLSLAFIFTSWIVWLAGYQFGGIGLTQRHIYWLNTWFSLGGSPLLQFQLWIDGLFIPAAVAGYFRSLSAILFQNSILAGMLLFIGLLFHSRIACSLSILGYATALIFFNLMGGFHQGQVSYYNLGTNFMLVAMALGGFYLIPSFRSYLWVMITVPIAYLLVVGLSNIFSLYGLPVFSLPFCITVILFLYCLPLRSHPGKLTLTPIQSYHPETNLYRYLNDKEQVSAAHTFPLMLPVMGEWMISQGHNGSMTHRGDWRHALDFVLLDEEHKTFQWPAAKPEDFYAYGKPVLSPGDGVVVEAIDYVLDNAIGENNTRQNWGNTIIIQHTTHLFSKLSHLKPGSLLVAKGQYVRKGEIIAQCGNSGRSPEPHLHFQLQATPYIGSRTLDYPMTAFLERRNQQTELKLHAVPTEGSFVKNLQLNNQLASAFSWQRGTQWQVLSSNGGTETWEAGISIYNESYLHCIETGAYAYYIVSDSQLRFSHYYGTQSSLLYFLYLGAHHVLFSLDIPGRIQHNMPLHLLPQKINRWFLDALAPFWIPGKMVYKGNVVQKSDSLTSEVSLVWQSEIVYASNPPLCKSELNILNGELNSMLIQMKDTQAITITLQCVS